MQHNLQYPEQVCWDKGILALDVATTDEAKQLIEKSKHHFQYYKVGLELFNAHHQRAMDLLINQNKKIFLDLKLHDIGETVLKTLEVLVNQFGSHLFLVSLHLSGPIFVNPQQAERLHHWMKQIKQRTECSLVGITILTSLAPDDLALLYGPQWSLEDQLHRFGKIAHQAHLDHLVCSPLEISFFKKNFPQLKLVIPGLRLPDSSAQDQQRIATPAQALQWGADYLVLGRTMTQGDYRQRWQQWCQSL